MSFKENAIVLAYRAMDSTRRLVAKVLSPLDEAWEPDFSHLDPDPLAQFKKWFTTYKRFGIFPPDAVCLATASPVTRPLARMVLFKKAGEKGITFFTNYQSRKGQALARNPNACLLFYWQPLERQVRVEGAIEKLTPAESDAYWVTRLRESQIGAWASHQSQVISGKDELDQRDQAFWQKFEGAPVPRPPYWGGFRLKPKVWEFWQARAFRLHDRAQYVKKKGEWVIEYLAP